MSIARHHNEWLSLVPNSGPFLSLPVLMRVFPQGLPAPDPELRKETRLMFEGWEDGKKDRAVRRSWVDFALRSVLQFPAEVVAEGQAIPPGMEARMSEFGEVLRPDVAIVPPKGSNSIKPRLLVQFFHPDQDLEKPLRDKHWKASPATRMTPLVTDAPIIIVALALASKLAELRSLLGLVSIAGAVFVLYLAWESFWPVRQESEQPAERPRSWFKGIVTNLLNPHPWIFWLTVGAAILAKATTQGWPVAAAFLFGFYLLLVGSKVLVALLTGRSRNLLGGRPYRMVMRVLAAMLALFAVLLFREGLKQMAVI